MQKLLKKMGFFTLALTMIMMTSGGTIASAATAPKDHPQMTASQKTAMTKSALDKLVKAGTIKSAQETAVIKALSTTKTSEKAALDSLIKAKTITQAQETAILKTFPAHGGFHGGGFANLVKTGKITQAQSDAIMKAMQAGRTKGTKMQATLDTLVKAKTISAAQEKTILANFKPKVQQ